MNRFLSIVEKLDTRLIALAALLLACVGFAIFEMVGAFGVHTAPAYRNRPAPAFDPPPSDQLVDPAYLTAERLPDDDYIAVYDIANKALPQVDGLLATASSLEALGVPPVIAVNNAQLLDGQRTDLAGRNYAVTAPLTLTSTDADGTEATMSATVSYSQSPSGAPPETAQVLLNFNANPADQWSLDDVSLTVQGAIVDSTGDSTDGSGQ